MRKQVMDLAGDPGTLVERGDPRLLLAKLFGPGGQRGRLLGLDAVVAPVKTQQQAHEQGGRIPEGYRAAHAAGYADRLDHGDPQPGHDPSGGQADPASRCQGGDEGQGDEVPAVPQR